MQIQIRIITLLIILIVFSPMQAACEKKPLWDLGVGLFFLQMPDYRGSDKYRYYLLPYPYFVYRGDILRVEKERVSGRIFETDRLLLDISFNGSAPVDSSDNPDRRGMPDLDPTFEVGPSVNITLIKDRQDRSKLTLTLPIRATFSTDFSSVHHEGWSFHPRLNYEKEDLIPGTGLNLGLSAGPMFEDRGYNRYFYAVEPAYATSARRAYAVDGGYGGTTVTVGLSKNMNSLILSGFMSLDFLQGAIFEDSPLVKRKYSLMTGFSVSWIFLKSSTMVEKED